MNISVEEFLNKSGTIFDVRSPTEFSNGHIPGAFNLPLFTDEERSLVGTAYKMQGRTHAFDLGLEFAEKKIPYFIDTIEKCMSRGMAKIHCWRGGLRSAAFAELFKAIGIETATLQGGYKFFRRWSNEMFMREANYHIIGGFTGTGKTKILSELKKMGQQTLDLESLSNHRGSVFGTIETPGQPPTEQFHNSIAFLLAKFDLKLPIWIEDESRLIGLCHVPEALYQQMRSSPLYIIERPIDTRLEILKRDYGSAKPENYLQGVHKIRKKLGNQTADRIIRCITTGNLKEAAKQVLKYYDSAYSYGIRKRHQKITKVSGDSSDCECAETLIKLSIP